MKHRNDLEFYDRIAEQWWDETAKIYALYHLNTPRFHYFDRHVPNWKGLQVLDVGCGGGFTCEFLAQRGAIVHGIDQSHHCITKAKEHAALSELAIVYQHSYSELLPYQDGSFDVVTCVDVLEHVANLQQTLEEIYRVLKPGGMFCFDTINQTLKSKLILIWLLEDVLQAIPSGVHDWQKFIKPEALRHLLQNIGFNTIEMKGFNVFGRSLLENVAAYRYYKQTGGFRIHIDDDTSVMYIGKAIKGMGYDRRSW
jgi:2-polyprenyl-6-hydroxyphenyl methylase / 3-demethylubiquinone-9 3-methyltransferase